MRGAIARWFFMSSLTGRFTGSPESAMEFDLARFREVKDADNFVNILENACDLALTDDYWKITLPNDLATSACEGLPTTWLYFLLQTGPIPLWTDSESTRGLWQNTQWVASTFVALACV